MIFFFQIKVNGYAFRKIIYHFHVCVPCRQGSAQIGNRVYHVNVFDMKFIMRDRKKRRNGEACRASPTCFRSNLINLIPKDTDMIFYLLCIIRRFLKGVKRLKQMKTYAFMFELADFANAL